MRLVTTEGATPSSRAALEKLPVRATSRNALMLSSVFIIFRGSRKQIVRSVAFSSLDFGATVFPELNQALEFPVAVRGSYMVISKTRIARALLLAAPAVLGTPAFAADPDQGGGGLEEVVVSAQFREEKLQSTPIAISAFTAENMEARGISNVTDLDAFVPNAVIQPLGAGWGATMAAFIRGVGLGDNILSFEPGVPIYVDDVYIGRPQGAIFDLLDLERVEVLRGPQGTLFGKNAEAGTIRLISVKPQGSNTGNASFTYGKFNRLEARAMADISVIDNFLNARFSFSSKKADGYFKLYDYVCANGAGSLGS